MFLAQSFDTLLLDAWVAQPVSDDLVARERTAVLRQIRENPGAGRGPPAKGQTQGAQKGGPKNFDHGRGEKDPTKQQKGPLLSLSSSLGRNKKEQGKSETQPQNEKSEINQKVAPWTPGGVATGP